MGEGLEVWVDTREVITMANMIRKGALNLTNQVQKVTREAANQTKNILREQTPVYEGTGQGNVPHTLEEAWRVDHISTFGDQIAYEINTGAAESKAETPWATPYSEVVNIITQGGTVNWYPARGKLLWWPDLYRGLESINTHSIDKNDFLTKTLESADGRGVYEKTALDIAVHIERDVIGAR